MFTIKDEVQNPEGISATDISYGDGTVAEALDGKQDAGDFVVFDPTTFTSALVVDGGGTQAFQINVDNKDDATYDRQAINFNKDSIIKYVRSKSDGKWVVDATFTADEDTGWQKAILESGFSNGGYEPRGIDYRRKNGYVTVNIFVHVTSVITKRTDKLIATLPEGFRPSIWRAAGSLGIGGSTVDTPVDAQVSVGQDGRILVWSTPADIPVDAVLIGSISFPV